MRHAFDRDTVVSAYLRELPSNSGSLLEPLQRHVENGYKNGARAVLRLGVRARKTSSQRLSVSPWRKVPTRSRVARVSPGCVATLLEVSQRLSVSPCRGRSSHVAAWPGCRQDA
jgi:hypothetical protein